MKPDIRGYPSTVSQLLLSISVYSPIQAYSPANQPPMPAPTLNSLPPIQYSPVIARRFSASRIICMVEFDVD